MNLTAFHTKIEAIFLMGVQKGQKGLKGLKGQKGQQGQFIGACDGHLTT